MIGTELLNLMYGDPLRQAMAPPQPAPNPNPQAPPRPTPIDSTPRPISPTTGQPMPLSSGDAARNFHPNAAGGIVPNVQTGTGASPMPTGAQGPAPSAPGGPTQPQPPQPQPLPQSGPPSTAPQSPTDLGQLYMQLYNRQRAANDVDRGLSMMAASVSTPQMANAIMGSSGRGDAQDPATAMNMLLQMRYMQQLANMPAPSGIDPNTWAASPPDVRSKIISEQAAGQVQTGTKMAEDRQKEVYDANIALPKLNTAMSDMDNRINIIKNTQEGDTTALENILSNPSKRNAVSSMLNAKETEGWMQSWMEQHQQQWANLTDAEKAVAMQMKQLSGQAYGEAFSSLGGSSRRSTAEVAGLKAGLSQITNLNQPYQSPDGKSGYLPALNQFQDQIHRGMANAYGAAQRLDDLPENLRWDSEGKPLMDSNYLPGGKLYDGRGGQWVNQPPPQKGGGGGTDFSKMSSTDADAAYAKLPSGTVFTAPDGSQRRKP